MQQIKAKHVDSGHEITKTEEEWDKLNSKVKEKYEVTSRKPITEPAELSGKTAKQTKALNPAGDAEPSK